MSAVLGIDPGASGGIAYINGDDVVDVLSFAKCIDSDVSAFLAHYSDARAWIEKVGATPQMGCVSAFKFGMSFGMLRGMLIAHAIPFQMVAPTVWQRDLGLIEKGRRSRAAGNPTGSTDSAKKRRNRQRASELFPGIRVTNAVADALLIAHHARRCSQKL